MASEALNRIRVEQSEKTGILHLGYSGITALPAEIRQLPWLQTLIVSNEYWDWELPAITIEGRGIDNCISSLPDWLQELPRLETLIIGGDPHTRWEIRDVTTLGKLTRLKKLILAYNSIENIEALCRLTNLRFLDLGTNYISKVQALKTLTKLEILDLSSNRIEQLEPIESLTELEKLYIHSNKIKNLSPLKKLTNLSVLRFNDNEVEDLSPLQHLTNIVQLDIRDNKVKHLMTIEPLIRKIPPYWEWQEGNGIFTQGCVFIDIPPERIGFGSEWVLSYWEELRRQGIVKVYEAKLMLVGEGLAGKTSIAAKITGGPEAPMPK